MAENQTVFVIDPAQNAAQKLSAEIAAKKEAGIEMHESQPGGYFIGTDGEPHDADGNAVKSADAPKAKGKK